MRCDQSQKKGVVAMRNAGHKKNGGKTKSSGGRDRRRGESTIAEAAAQAALRALEIKDARTENESFLQRQDTIDGTRARGLQELAYNISNILGTLAAKCAFNDPESFVPLKDLAADASCSEREIVEICEAVTVPRIALLQKLSPFGVVLGYYLGDHFAVSNAAQWCGVGACHLEHRREQLATLAERLRNEAQERQDKALRRAAKRA